MVLIQLTMTWNDIFGVAPITSNATVVTKIRPLANPITVQDNPTLLYNVNLDRGTYKAKIVGIKIACGYPQLAEVALTNRPNPMLFGLQSTSFRFPASSDNTFWFSGSAEYSLGDITGDKEFIIENPTGQMDITLRLIMFGQKGALGEDQAEAPFYTANNVWYWDDSLFAYLLLTIDVEPMDLPHTDHDYSRRKGFF